MVAVALPINLSTNHYSLQLICCDSLQLNIVGLSSFLLLLNAVACCYSNPPATEAQRAAPPGRSRPPPFRGTPPAPGRPCRSARPRPWRTRPTWARPRHGAWRGTGGTTGGDTGDGTPGTGPRGEAPGDDLMVELMGEFMVELMAEPMKTGGNSGLK